IVANDADLNRTYQELVAQARKSGGPDLEDRFRQSQREWINQRDSDCTAQTQSTDGKLWARARARCLADYSGRRTAELQRNLSSLRGQYGGARREAGGENCGLRINDTADC